MQTKPLEDTIFTEDTNGLDTIVIDKSVSLLKWNSFLPVPLVPGETVFVHPDQSDVRPGYKRIIHGSELNTSIFSEATLDVTLETPDRRIEMLASLAESRSIANTSDLEDVLDEKPVQKVKPKTGISFMGNDYTKSGVVLAVVKQHVNVNPGITLAELKEAFPDTLLRRFGIAQEISTANTIANGGARYFTKNDQQITVSDATVVVCNQITSDNIKPFISRAGELGYTITIES